MNTVDDNPILPGHISRIYEIELFYLDNMGIIWFNCGAAYFKYEKLTCSTRFRSRFEKCCNNGQHYLPVSREIPAYLKMLFAGETRESKCFLKNSRRFNAVFAFSSFVYSIDPRFPGLGGMGRRFKRADGLNGGQTRTDNLTVSQQRRRVRQNDPAAPPYQGIKDFTGCGNLFHCYVFITDNPTAEKDRYAQFWLYDSDTAHAKRCFINPDLNHDTLRELQIMLEERNDLCRKWKSAIEKLREILDTDRVTVDWEMNLTTESVSDMRRENLPSLDEVAAVLENENIALEKRKIVVAQKNISDFTVIQAGYPAYFPMGYPLFWPYGDPEWTYKYPI